MEDLLRAEYEQDHDRSLGDLVQCLDRYDVLDERIARLEDRLEREIEERGPGSRKLKALRDELDQLRAERRELAERERRASSLELRQEPESGQTG
jgi:hypothetical protein